MGGGWGSAQILKAVFEVSCLLFSPSVWLVTPLISRLQEGVLGRVLKSAGNVLGQGQWWNPEKNQEKRRATRATRYKGQIYLSVIFGIMPGQQFLPAMKVNFKIQIHLGGNVILCYPFPNAVVWPRPRLVSNGNSPSWSWSWPACTLKLLPTKSYWVR